MTWQYKISTGQIWRDGSFEGQGYSGHGDAVNDPTKTAIPGVGPIPVGRYKIGPARTSANTGPLTMNLDPVGHNALDRSLLRIHGDNALGNRSASHGCLVAGRAIRQAISSSGDTDLEVVE